MPCSPTTWGKEIITALKSIGGGGGGAVYISFNKLYCF